MVHEDSPLGNGLPVVVKGAHRVCCFSSCPAHCYVHSQVAAQLQIIQEYGDEWKSFYGFLPAVILHPSIDLQSLTNIVHGLEHYRRDLLRIESLRDMGRDGYWDGN